MAKKHKRRLSKSPPMDYEFEVGDWEVSYSFQGRLKDSTINPASYDEFAQLVIYGKPTQPVYRDVCKAQICLWAEPEIEDHWNQKHSAKAHSTV